MTASDGPGTKPLLVWSGPRTSTHRDTRSVFEELFTTAKHTLWVSSYVSRSRRDILGRVAEHLDATPRLTVTLVLNVPRYKGDDRAAKRIVKEFAERFWKRWPATKRPRVYYDPRPLYRRKGLLHAKLVVADHERVFVTSANLTGPAWDDNIELGVLLRDRDLAKEVVAHLERLIDRKHLKPLPGSHTLTEEEKRGSGGPIAWLKRRFK